MCTLIFLSLDSCIKRQCFIYLVLLFLGLIAIATSIDENHAKRQSFIPWGQSCKIPAKGESLKSNERCDETRGMLCEKYIQGNFCGCRLDNADTISYDPWSKECRLKVGQFCHYVNQTAHPAYYEKLSFNAKCHERAECKSLRDISKQENHKKSDDTLCMCKRGYSFQGFVSM